MAEPIPHHPLRGFLRRAWLEFRKRWFEKRGNDTATAEEVRSITRQWLEHDSNRTVNVLRFWYPLDDEEKQRALLDAFSDKDYSSGADEEEQYVIELLQEYAGRFEEISRLIGDKRFLTREEKERGHLMLKDLKESLDADPKDCAGREDTLTNAEKHYFYPAVLKAHANIRVRWNSDPIKSKWIQELGSARLDITHTLHQLTHKRPK